MLTQKALHSVYVHNRQTHGPRYFTSFCHSHEQRFSNENIYFWNKIHQDIFISNIIHDDKLKLQDLTVSNSATILGIYFWANQRKAVLIRI